MLYYVCSERRPGLKRYQMSRLNKKLLRDLMTHWPQVLAIVAVITLGIIMFSGPLMAQRDLRDSVNDIYRRTNYEDFSVEVDKAPFDAVREVEALENVTAVEGRATGELIGDAGDGRMTLRVISVPNRGRPRVNGLLVEQGRYLEPDEYGACMVEHHLTEATGVVPGDTVTLGSEEEEIELEVVGSVVSPEYIWLVRSRAEYVSDPSQFGVIFVEYGLASRLFGLEDGVNDVVATVADTEEIAWTMESAGEILEPYGVTGLTTGSEEPGAVTLNDQINALGRLALFFAVLLLAVASLALYITMTQIIYSQQRQIGVARAVGYSGRPLMAHYLGYGVVLGVSGGFLGVLVGYLLSRVFIDIYAGIFDLPLITSSVYWAVAGVALGVSVIFSVAGALIPSWHAVRMKPAEAMRTEAGLALGISRSETKKSVTERMGFPVWLRVSLRNLVRNRRRTLLTCLGVVATLCLLVTATGGKDSLDNAVDKYLNGVVRWDAAAVWTEPVGEDLMDKVRGIEGVEVAEPLIDAPALVTADGASVDIQIQAFREDTVLHGDFPTPGSKARPGPGEIVLNRGVKKKLPVDIGSEVQVSTSIGSLSFTVAGFLAEPFGGVGYVNLKYIQEPLAMVTGEEEPFNAVVVRAAEGAADEVAEGLQDLPGVSQTVTRDGILTVFEDLVESIKTLFVIFYVMAFAMGFSILFAMVTVNLLERRREIATFRTLGAGMTRIFNFLTVETLTVVVASLLPGILLGRLLEWFVIEKLLSTERLVPDTVLSAPTVAVIVSAAIAVTIVAELPSLRKLWRLDLARVTKERAD